MPRLTGVAVLSVTVGWVTGAPEGVAAMVEASRKGPIGAYVAEVTTIPDEDDGSHRFVARSTV